MLTDALKPRRCARSAGCAQLDGHREDGCRGEHGHAEEADQDRPGDVEDQRSGVVEEEYVDGQRDDAREPGEWNQGLEERLRGLIVDRAWIERCWSGIH